jgi:hypothetical protein
MTTLVDQALSAGTPIAVSLTNTLNALTSNHAARLAAITDRLPGSILALLFVSTIVTTFLIGRSQGFSGSSDLRGELCFCPARELHDLRDARPESGGTRLHQGQPGTHRETRVVDGKVMFCNNATITIRSW